MESDDDWKDKVYVCETVLSGVSIVIPCNDYDGDKDEWLEFTELAEIKHLELYPIQLPGDRYFREAWVLDGESVVIDMELAKKIHIDNLRERRDELLKETDVMMLRAFESGSDHVADHVIDLRQKLRNMPDDEVFNVDTIEELRRVMPPYLERPAE